MLTENRTNPQVLNQFETITTGLSTPYEVAVDETNLVVTTNDSLTEVEEFGGVTTIAQSVDNNSINNVDEIEIIVDGLSGPYGIVVNNNDLAVTVDGALLNIDAFGNLTTLASLNDSPALDVFFDGSDFVVLESVPPAFQTASLLRVSQTGDVETIAMFAGDPIGLAVQGEDFIVVDFNQVNGNPTVGNGRLLRISEDGNNTSIIASENLGGASEVVVEDNNFWLTDFSLGRLLKVSPSGNVTEIATGLGQPLDIELDGENFIITDFADGFNNPGLGRILRVSKTGQVETLLSGIGNPSGIAIEGSDIFFTDIVQGTVNRVQVESVPENASITEIGNQSGLTGTDESDNLIGTDVNDFISGNRQDDLILGRDGNDLLHGGKGDDIVDGGAGIDIIIGDQDDDVLIGGTGSDRFDFAANHGNNIIVDFEDGIDAIGLDNSLSFEQLTISQIGNDTRISVDQFSVTLQGVTQSVIGVDDFI